MPFYWTFLPFFCYSARMPLFSRISPVKCFHGYWLRLWTGTFRQNNTVTNIVHKLWETIITIFVWRFEYTVDSRTITNPITNPYHEFFIFNAPYVDKRLENSEFWLSCKCQRFAMAWRYLRFWHRWFPNEIWETFKNTFFFFLILLFM